MHELIGRFEGYQGVPVLFEEVANRKIKIAQSLVPAGSWTGKIKLTLNQAAGNRRLALNAVDSGTIIPTSSPAGTQGLDEPVFTVLSANADDTFKSEPTMGSVSYPPSDVSGSYRVLRLTDALLPSHSSSKTTPTSLSPPLHTPAPATKATKFPGSGLTTTAS
jgi:hypothetical protein